MGCNDYNLHLEGSEGNESPTPEYKIYLDGVGVNGYSPTVDIVNENTASFQIQTNDINGSELTSPIPKLSYLQSDYVSNTSLASTLADYSTTAQMNTALADKLNTNGSNNSTPFYLPHVTVGDTGINAGKYSGDYYIRIKRSSGVGEPAIQLGYNNVLGQEDHDSSHLKMRQGSGTGLDLSTYSTENDLSSYKPLYINRFLGQNKVYYHGNENTNELATVGDIKNSTITLTQGGVTKGSFTLNQSGNATIDLDAGGSVITNPLTLTSTDGTRSLTLGINNSNNKLQSTYNFISGGSTFSSSIYLLGGATSPLTLTDDNYGKYTIALKYDDDTIKVNQDGELYAVGGGGTTYTAGTGIDITSNVISIDTDVVAQLSDIPDVSDFVTNSSLTTTLQNYVLSSSLATVATSGSYNDLLNKPTIPTNSDYVDLTTDQTVGGTKTFSNDQKFGGYIYLNGSSNAQGVVHRVGTTRKGLVVRNNQFETVYVGNTYDALQLSGSGTRPTYYANSTSKDIAFTDDIPSLTNYVTNTDYATTSVGGVVKVDGSTITIDANGVISATGGSGGLQNTATGTNSLTILGSPTSASTSINIGSSSTATRGNSVAIGNNTNTVSQYSVAIGYNAKAGTSSDSSNGAVAIGYNAGGDYSKGNTVAVGNNAVAKSTGSIAIGNSSEVGNTNYTNGIAIGNSSQVYGANSINLGYGANTTANTLSVGFYGQNSNHPYTLLNGTTGLIPDERLSSNIARTTNVANTDLSNLVSSAGDIITNAIMPDLTQTVFFSSGTIIELPYDAFVNGSGAGGNGTTWVGIDLYVYSDSAGTTQIFYRGAASLYTATASMYLPKGSYVKIVGTGPYYSLSYTPLKGVN